MTQAELAEKANLSKHTVWRIENKQGARHIPNLENIARALGTTVAKLEGQNSKRQGILSRIEKLTDGQFKRLLKELAKIEKKI